ncbi:cysteine desulfurase [Cricetulus griseus]|uniref:Cysteine desulfurase n=1 Tax=Cricetulus griseus TaxID=10029 RepID=A0A061IMF3_CRIGR|nr:cysteine desulfurase [Cricetulus griseus]
MNPARQQVASLIAADPREIIFTSEATESNNMAMKGVTRFYKSRVKHMVTTQTEHKCVLDSCRSLEAEDFRVTHLPVQKSGIIDLKELEAAIPPDTSLVSVKTVNNEMVVKQPIAEIGQICSSTRVYFHTDAAQDVGKISLDVNDMKIDLMSISGHKFYGLKGLVLSISGIGTGYVWRSCGVEVDWSRDTSASLEPSDVLRATGTGEDLAHSSIRFGIGHFTAEEEWTTLWRNAFIT